MATEQQRQQELARILERDGGIRPSVVVEEARPKRAKLHDEFEWNNEKAAEEYRLSQARRLIRVTQIVMPTGERQPLIHVRPVQVDGPTAVEQQREGVYKPAAVVASCEVEYEAALDELRGQVRAIEKTIKELERAAGQKVRPLIKTLSDAMTVAKDTIRLMRDQTAA